MKDAYYFPHDSNAKDDPKCVLLIEQLGLEGYGIYWVLIEILRDQPDYKYPIILIPSIARKYSTTVEKIKTVIISYGLFETNEKEFFFSDSLIRRMTAIDTRRKILSESGKKGRQKQLQLALQADSVATPGPPPGRKGKESKEKEIEYFKDSEVNTAFLEYLEVRKKLKCPNTERVLTRLQKKLKEYAPNKSEALEVINKAITCNWKDFYPLKKDNL